MAQVALPETSKQAQAQGHWLADSNTSDAHRLIDNARALYDALAGLLTVLPGSWDCLTDEEVAAWKAAEAAVAKARVSA